PNEGDPALETKPWSGTAAANFAWNHMKKDPIGIVGSLALVQLVMFFPALVAGGYAGLDAATIQQNPADPTYLAVEVASTLLLWALQGLLSAGQTRFALAVVRGQRYSLADAFSGPRWFAPSLANAVLAGAVFLPGSIAPVLFHLLDVSPTLRSFIP